MFSSLGFKGKLSLLDFFFPGGVSKWKNWGGTFSGDTSSAPRRRHSWWMTSDATALSLSAAQKFSRVLDEAFDLEGTREKQSRKKTEIEDCSDMSRVLLHCKSETHMSISPAGFEGIDFTTGHILVLSRLKGKQTIEYTFYNWA